MCFPVVTFGVLFAICLSMYVFGYVYLFIFLPVNSFIHLRITCATLTLSSLCRPWPLYIIFWYIFFLHLFFPHFILHCSLSSFFYVYNWVYFQFYCSNYIRNPRIKRSQIPFDFDYKQNVYIYLKLFPFCPVWYKSDRHVENKPSKHAFVCIFDAVPFPHCLSSPNARVYS